MIALADIRSFARQIVRRFKPTAVILFGSYAYGHPTKDSDVDLMVVMPHRGSGPQMATKIRLACPRSFPVDLIVRKPSEVRRSTGMGDSFLRQVTSKGVVLYETRGASGSIRPRRTTPPPCSCDAPARSTAATSSASSSTSAWRNI